MLLLISLLNHFLLSKNGGFMGKTTLKVALCGTVTSVVFGLSFLFTKNALDFVNIFDFLAIRFTVSFVSMMAIMFFLKVRVTRKPYYKLLPLAIFQPVLYFIFETLGLVHTSSSQAGIIVSTLPIFTLIASRIFLREKIKPAQVIFMVLSLLGALMIIGINLSDSGILGDMYLLFAVFSAVGYSLLSKKLSAQFNPFEITFFMMFCAMIFFNAAGLIDNGIDYGIMLNPQVLAAALYLGVLSSAVNFILLNYMLSKVSPIVSSIFGNLTTVVSVAAGALIRGEALFWYHICGMVFIIAGVMGINWISSRKAKD